MKESFDEPDARECEGGLVVLSVMNPQEVMWSLQMAEEHDGTLDSHDRGSYDKCAREALKLIKSMRRAQTSAKMSWIGALLVAHCYYVLTLCH